MNLNIDKIPESVHIFIANAIEWGIGDDYEREQKIKNATDTEILELCRIGDFLADDQGFNDWLFGDISIGFDPDLEYVIFTNLTMAIDSARLARDIRKI